MREKLLATVQDAYSAELCINPPRQDGTKAPLGESDKNHSWERFQSERPSREQVTGWYENHDRTGIGIFCGKVSNYLEVLDFDVKDIYFQFKEVCIKTGLGELINRLEAAYCEQSPNGVHLLYYCETISRNMKLATRDKEEHEKKHSKDITATLIETRGEGGFIIIAPTYGTVNPAGSYTVSSGSISTILKITPDERSALHERARTLHAPNAKAIQHEHERCRRESGDYAERPGDDFNIRGSWSDLLIQHGWILEYTRGGTDYWIRPGKSHGKSATTNHAGSGLLYVFTSSTEFEPNRGYSKFSAYTLLNHGGDYSAAARELAQLGYGKSQLKAIHSVVNASISIDAATCTDVAVPDLFTDTRVSKYFSELYSNELRYWTDAAKWLVNNGALWSTNVPGSAYPYIKGMIKQLYLIGQQIEDPKKRVEFISNILKLESHTRQTTLLTAAQFIPELVIKSDQLDQHPMLLNVRNGTIDLNTGVLRAHSSKDFITKLINVDYCTENQCPTFLDFLNHIFESNQDLIRYLQRYIGYCLTGRTDEQVLLFLHGTGENGKTTLANIVESLLFDYAITGGSASLLKQDNRTATNDIAAFFGARLVKISEFNDGERLDEARIKTLTGGDRITCRFLYQEYFSYTPSYKIMLIGNHKPKVRGCDHGIWRRIHLLPFKVTIKEEKDKGLPSKLINELPGILAWAVQGCLEWQKIGLQPPPEVLAEVAEYRRSEDIFQQWLDECCVLSEKHQTAASELHESFVSYSNWQQISINKFGRMLAERNFKKSKSSTIIWSGIGLLENI
jgi:putative DNA primase/helicase